MSRPPLYTEEQSTVDTHTVISKVSALVLDWPCRGVHWYLFGVLVVQHSVGDKHHPWAVHPEQDSPPEAEWGWQLHLPLQ